MLRTRHSKRNEHTGENEPPKRKKKGARYVEHSQLLPFEETASLPQTPNKNGCQKAKNQKEKE